MREDLAALLAVTRDEGFATAGHCLQSPWKVGVAGEGQRRVLVDGLIERFKECAGVDAYGARKRRASSLE